MSVSKQLTLLKDYKAPDFFIEKTELNFQLGELATVVMSRMEIRRNPAADSKQPLVLNGERLELKQLMLDGRILNPAEYTLDETTLTLPEVPERFEIQCTTLIQPQKNTTLEGLYKSGTMFCTQCEAEGFRRITYYLDRPDVMSEFTTTILADRRKYPVLLSNGNEEARGTLSGSDMHWVKWRDPFKKPSYLFAMVAGSLRFQEDYFITCSGRKITLRIFVEEKDLNKLDHAMSSLKRAMRWDEKAYGREYDLDIYMIVAVDDFNMGAMENKGLNIFNTSCVLASPDTTTDAGYQRVEAVIAHEYFHNWSGNRVTCRDWFQLSLKEGFTVFRDSQYTADMGSAVIKRIEDATLMRTAQFAEDASPMAHPVQPASYLEISNFYTLTIYEKGAEVVRMLHTLLGNDMFRKGCDLYFSRYDGQAVTIEEFITSMEEVSVRNLTRFRYWYTQAGTPTLSVSDSYDLSTMTYHLTFKQTCPPTSEAHDKEAFHIPVSVALLGERGPLTLFLDNELLDLNATNNHQRLLEITKSQQTFTFQNVTEKPVPSLLRNFSSPVKLQYPYSRNDLMSMMIKDTDGFNRWNACQQLGLLILQDLIRQHQHGKPFDMDNKIISAYRSLLHTEISDGKSVDKAMLAHMLILPSESFISEQMDIVDVEAIHLARQYAKHRLANELQKEFVSVYENNVDLGIYRTSHEAVAQRSLKNTALAYLMLLETKDLANICLDQYNRSTNMTDVSAALIALINCPATFVQNAKEKALRLFYRRWQQEALVVNQWLSMQASCVLPDTFSVVKDLMTHDAFNINNPNKVRALIGVFCNQNPVNFHIKTGEGYKFLAEQVIRLDAINPQIAARLLLPLSKWRRYDDERQKLMRESLEIISARGELSKDVYEVVSKSLAAN
jgi:aminopeptidase N